MEVSFYLKRPKAKITSIYAEIWYHGQVVKYYPGETIEVIHWNKKKKEVRQTHHLYANYNRRLDNIKIYAEDCLKEFQNSHEGKLPSTEELKELLDLKIKKVVVKKQRIDLFKYFETIIKRSENGIRLHHKTNKKIAGNTIKTYVTIKNTLVEYQKLKKLKLTFENIDIEFYNTYHEYLLLEKKYSNNTIGKHFQIIKTVMNEASEDGLHKNLDFKKKKFKVIKEDVENIYLNEKELDLFIQLDLSKTPTLDRVRDLFIVGCYTGLRFSDLSVLKNTQIVGDFMEVTQIKTGGDKIAIPIHSIVTKILAKYNGSFPKAISNQKTNEYLKDIAEKIDAFKEIVSITSSKGVVNTERYKLVKTHTARRSFATNQFLAGTPTIIIMAITGHKSEKAFLKYIKATSKEKAEYLLKIWRERELAKTI